MKPVVVVTGANGFLGRYLCRHLARRGKEVVAVGRRRDGWSGDGMFLEWDGTSVGPWALALEGAEAVIHLAGRSVNCRYTPEHRREILESRVAGTRAVGAAVESCKVPPKLWINAGTATWYVHAEDHPQNEWLGEPGDGFSVEVARAWEDAFFACQTPGFTRKVVMRIGMVLANESGTVYPICARLARCGLAGPMGGGRQRVAWIHMDDFLAATEHIMNEPLLDGVINVVAPEAPDNRDWMRAVRNAEGVGVGLPCARWMMRLGARVLGTEAELMLKSRWVDPLRLRTSGFRWKWPQLHEALADLRERPGLAGFFPDKARRSVGVRVWVAG